MRTKWTIKGTWRANTIDSIMRRASAKTRKSRIEIIDDAMINYKKSIGYIFERVSHKWIIITQTYVRVFSGPNLSRGRLSSARNPNHRGNWQGQCLRLHWFRSRINQSYQTNLNHNWFLISLLPEGNLSNGRTLQLHHLHDQVRWIPRYSNLIQSLLQKKICLYYHGVCLNEPQRTHQIACLHEKNHLSTINLNHFRIPSQKL